MNELVWNVFIGIMLFIVWFPVIVWVVLFILFFVLLIRCVVFKITQTETVFFVLLLLFVCSFPAFKIFSAWLEKRRLDSMMTQIVQEEGRVVQGLKLPAGTKLSYRSGKHDFKDEDVEKIYFQSVFSWGNLKIDYISHRKIYTLTNYPRETDSDIVKNVISVNIESDSVIDGWWCESDFVDLKRKAGKPKFDLTRENYELASCKLNKEIKLKFGEVEYMPSFYWGSIAHKEENDSFESLMDEVSKKTDGKISGKSLIRVNQSGRFFLETEWGKLSVVNAELIIDSDKNILFFDASLMPVDEEFIRLGGCLYKKPQKVVLSPSRKKQLLNVVFEGEDIESQCKKHILYYKFVEK